MQRQKQHKKKHVAAVGGLFILLAIIGALTIIVLSVRLTVSLLDNQRQKHALADWLHPVVMFDPPPFSSPTEIDMPRLLQYSMWGVLSDEKSKDYERVETSQSLLVPASDVEAAAYTLFGNAVTLEHATFSDNETTYYYNEEDNVYEVPTFGYLYVYRPEVERVQKVGNEYHVLVKYVPPDNAWNTVYAGGVEFFSNKMMVYIVERPNSDEWRLLGVQDPPQDVINELDLPMEGIPTESAPPDLDTDAQDAIVEDASTPESSTVTEPSSQEVDPSPNPPSSSSESSAVSRPEVSETSEASELSEESEVSK